MRSAIKKLWDEHIRTDLIFGRNLLVCLKCFNFGYVNDNFCNHEKCELAKVRDFFIDKKIDSVDKLTDFLWGTHSLLVSSADEVRYSSARTTAAIGQHEVSDKTSFKNESSVFLGLHKRIGELQGVLMEASNRMEALQGVNDLLRKENDAMLTEVLQLRQSMSNDFSSISKLAWKIQCLCHDQGCECREEEVEK